MAESVSRRRGRNMIPRPHRVGPVRFSDEEFTWVTVAAARAGQARAAYVAAAAAAVASGEVTPLPADEHEQLRVLISLRGDLQQLASRVDQALAAAPDQVSAPTGSHLARTLDAIDQTVRRVDETVSALLPYRAGQ